MKDEIGETMGNPINKLEGITDDQVWLYYKLEELRDPPFITIFWIVLKVMLAAFIIEIVFALIIFFLLSVFGTVIFAAILNFIHSIQYHSYDFIFPLMRIA